MIEEDDGSFGKEHPYSRNDLDVVEELREENCKFSLCSADIAVPRSFEHSERERVLTLVKCL